MIVHESAQMASMLKAYATSQHSVPFVPESIHYFLRRHLDFEMLASKLSRDEWISMIEDGLSASWSVITGSISILMSVFSWAVVLLYVVFIMIDYERISRGFRHMVMPKYRKTVFSVAHDVKVSMNRYFRGQALVSFIVGILFSIGFLIMGLPMAIVLGMFIGLLNMVPLSATRIAHPHHTYMSCMLCEQRCQFLDIVLGSHGHIYNSTGHTGLDTYTPYHRKSNEYESRHYIFITLRMGDIARTHRTDYSNTPYDAIAFLL